MRRKVFLVIGTRPEAIKMAPIAHELYRRANRFDCVICLTGQHREMVDQALQAFELTADFDLKIMAAGQTLADVTARAIEGLDGVLRQSRPDVVLVQGDTTTAFCGALAAAYHQIEVGHVEAGLRTGDKRHPFPEEINRALITRLSDWHFPPTEHAAAVLRGEGVDPTRIVVTGNPVIDALLWTRDRVRDDEPGIPLEIGAVSNNGPLVLVTGHRRESFGDGFENICGAIRDVADAHPRVSFVYPVHLNPNVREPVFRTLGGHPRIKLIEPLSYRPFIWLMNRATIVLTDSGGVQEEAPALGKPVLVMRQTTERPEGIAAGNARLVGTARTAIVEQLLRLLNDPAEREAMAQVRNPYGDGTAARQIVDALA
jgi:UDP-N-acetylglucosamine 2-epimerase (non-hydrolysing)